MNIILGIDLGIALLGFSLCKKENNKQIFLSYGCIITNKETKKEMRLLLIFQYMEKIIKDFQPNIILIENVFHSRNTKTVNLINKVHGVIYLLSAKYNLFIYEFSPSSIKKQVLGNTHANKNDAKLFVKEKLNIYDEKIIDDVADAILITQMTFK